MKHSKSQLKADEIAVFCEQLTLLISGGVSVYDGVYLMYQEAEEGRDKEILKGLNEAVSSNIPLFQALEESGAFPEYMIHLVSVGERTGHLEDVFRSLAAYYDRESRLKSRIRSAVTYPLVIFSVIACIMLVLVVKILPMFERMFDELAADVSATTANSISLGLAAGRVAAIIVGVIILILLLICAASLTKSGKKLLHKFFTGSSITRGLSQLIASGRLVSSLSMILSSGMDVADGLDRELESCEDPVVKERVQKCIDLYNDRNSLDESIAGSGIVSGMDAQLLSVAAKTGGSDDALAKIAERYDAQIGDRVSRMTTVIETTLVVTLTLMVGAVLVSIMVPLANLIASVG